LFGLKYIDLLEFTHHVGSMGAPSRRKMFNRGTNSKHGEASNIASGDMKTNIFQLGKAEFEATINLNEETRVKTMSPFM
jgi:hypothetical protein